MRENLMGMVDVDWLRAPSKSHKRIPECIERRFPIVNSEKLIEAFVKLNRKPVTLIACPNVAEAALAIPFLVGVISAGNAENFKMIIAQKKYTYYTIDMLNELIISSEGEFSPVNLQARNFRDQITRGQANDYEQCPHIDHNLKIVTFPNAHNYIEEAMELSDSHLTHLVIEAFDGENCLDMELLFLAIQLTQIQKSEQFSVIILTDGLVHESKSRVEKICEGVVSLQLANILCIEKERPERDVIIVNSTTSDINQVKEEGIYDRLEKSLVTEVYLEREDPVTPPDLMQLIKNTILLIKHFIDDEINRGKGSPFTYIVFTASCKVMRTLLQEIKNITMNTDIEIVTIRRNGDLKYLQDMNMRHIVLVSENAEDAFVLDNINIVIDMGLISWKSKVTSIGSNQVRTIWSDRVRMIRRANLIERGTVAYPFNNAKLQSMRTRSISKLPGFDLEMRYFHDCKRWSYKLNDGRTNSFMKKAEDISIRAGLISYKDPMYCTPIGSFCSAVLPLLSHRLAKLVLCGIVCGCEDATIALASILNEDSAALQIELSRRMSSLMELVKVGIRSEHLALLHAYDRRYNPTGLHSSNYNQVKNMERREGFIRARIKKEPERMGLGIFIDDEEVEKRLLLALAMAFGDRIGYAPNGDEKGESRYFQVEDHHNGEIFKFETCTKFAVNEEDAGIYYELREKEKYSSSTTEVTMLPLPILAAIGNIGGRGEKSTEGFYLTTNTGGLHVKMSEMEHVDEMIDLRNEVRMEVQRVALSYLQSDRYIPQFKRERDSWMDELFPLLTTIHHNS